MSGPEYHSLYSNSVWAGQSRVQSRVGQEIFSFPTPSRLALRPNQPPLQWVMGLFHKDKVAGIWPWTPSSAKVTMGYEELARWGRAIILPPLCACIGMLQDELSYLYKACHYSVLSWYNCIILQFFALRLFIHDDGNRSSSWNSVFGNTQRNMT